MSNPAAKYLMSRAGLFVREIKRSKAAALALLLAYSIGLPLLGLEFQYEVLDTILESKVFWMLLGFSALCFIFVLKFHIRLLVLNQLLNKDRIGNSILLAMFYPFFGIWYYFDGYNKFFGNFYDLLKVKRPEHREAVAYWAVFVLIFELSLLIFILNPTFIFGSLCGLIFALAQILWIKLLNEMRDMLHPLTGSKLF